MLERIIDLTIDEFPYEWSELVAGREKFIGFFIGQVIKRYPQARAYEIEKSLNERLGDDES